MGEEDLVLTKDVAEKYATCRTEKGWLTSLNKYKTIADDAAQFLCDLGDGVLYLNGLQTISDETAMQFGKFEDSWLELNGIKALSNPWGQKTRTYILSDEKRAHQLFHS